MQNMRLHEDSNFINYQRLPLVITYVYIYIYYMYIYIYIYIQTHTHTHIYIYIQRLILVAYDCNFSFSAKVKHKKGPKENLEKRSFALYQHSCMMYLSFFLRKFKGS